MHERPILFSAPMVRAILARQKTMTRRALNERDLAGFAAAADLGECGRFLDGQPITPADRNYHSMLCRYGEPGDRLWVRETFQPILAHGVDYAAANYKTGEGYTASYPATDGRIEFVDSEDEISDRCKPAIHMPRWASRILLEITSTRIERLQEISGMEAKWEGVTIPSHLPQDGADLDWARREFQSLWSSINGEDSWNANPWVWVVEFRLLLPATLGRSYLPGPCPLGIQAGSYSQSTTKGDAA